MYTHTVWPLKEILFGFLNSNVFAKIQPRPLIEMPYTFSPQGDWYA